MLDKYYSQVFVFRDEILCDIKLETDDGGIIFGHKVVLASASTYFHAMFTHFSEKNQDQVTIRQLDYSALQLLIDFIYSRKISITEKNVKVIVNNFYFIRRQNCLCCFLFIF